MPFLHHFRVVTKKVHMRIIFYFNPCVEQLTQEIFMKSKYFKLYLHCQLHLSHIKKAQNRGQGICPQPCGSALLRESM